MTGDFSPTGEEPGQSLPSSSDRPVQGKGGGWQEPGERALPDIKLQKTLACLEMGLLRGKHGDLAIFCATQHRATPGGLRTRSLGSPLQGSWATDPRTDVSGSPPAHCHRPGPGNALTVLPSTEGRPHAGMYVQALRSAPQRDLFNRAGPLKPFCTSPAGRGPTQPTSGERHEGAREAPGVGQRQGYGAGRREAQAACSGTPGLRPPAPHPLPGSAQETSSLRRPLPAPPESVSTGSAHTPSQNTWAQIPPPPGPGSAARYSSSLCFRARSRNAV